MSKDIIHVAEYGVHLDVKTGNVTVCEFDSIGENRALENAIQEHFKGDVLDAGTLNNLIFFIKGYMAALKY